MTKEEIEFRIHELEARVSEDNDELRQLRTKLRELNENATQSQLLLG